MKLPLEWITERVPIEAGAEEIAERLTMAGFEVEGKGESARGPVLDIKVTPNRGDGLSVLGVARELSAVYRIPMAPSPSFLLGKQGEQQYAAGVPHDPPLVTIDTPDLCPRYAARIVRDVKVGPSPAWMQERIEAAGMRPINNIVDATNYVMLETGQPLHAFDYDKLKGGRIVVRRARSGESMTTLDGVERTLTPGMLVIADAERAVALAGIMGGAETEMSDSTTTVLIESAHFAPLTIRRTAKAQAISTEASYRFQRYVDPAGVAAAANRACELIAEVGAGDPDTELADVYPDPIQPRTIIVRPERVTAMLGFDVSLEEVTESLQWLGFERRQTFFTPYSSLLEFVVPSWRPDIVREIDMVEEVGRVLGYENIPEKLPEGHSTQGGDSAAGRFAERVREALVGAGLQEIVSHSLLAPTNLEDPRSEELRVPIRSALSAELSGLRRSLLPGLMDALERNGRRGNSPLAFFEIGKVFSRSDGFYCEAGNIGGVLAGPLGPATWDKRSPVLPADFHAARGIVELMCDRLHVTGLRFAECDDPRFHPGRSATILFGNIDLGYVGELHPRLSADLRIRDRIVVFELMVDPLQISAAAGKGFQPISAYPAVSRDLAPRVDAAVPYSTVEAAVHSAGVPLLEEFRLTDVFTGAPLPAGMKSLTLSFTFRAPDRTLTDAEVTDALARIRTTLETGCGASFAG